jgi:hypothetical protein
MDALGFAKGEGVIKFKKTQEILKKMIWTPDQARSDDNTSGIPIQEIGTRKK